MIRVLSNYDNSHLLKWRPIHSPVTETRYWAPHINTQVHFWNSDMLIRSWGPEILMNFYEGALPRCVWKLILRVDSDFYITFSVHNRPLKAIAWGNLLNCCVWIEDLDWIWVPSSKIFKIVVFLNTAKAWIDVPEAAAISKQNSKDSQKWPIDAKKFRQSLPIKRSGQGWLWIKPIFGESWYTRNKARGSILILNLIWKETQSLSRSDFWTKEAS